MVIRLKDDELIKTIYSRDKEYYCEIIIKTDGTFWVLDYRKVSYVVTDDGIDYEFDEWIEVGRPSHIADTYQQAEMLVDECIRNHTGSV